MLDHYATGYYMTRFRLITAAALIGGPLEAQQATRLEELQVTATRVAAPLSSVAAAITVIEGDELRQRGITFLLDALGEVPGASTVQTGSYGAVASLFLRGGESDFTKVLVDGVPLNQPGGSLNLANLQLDDVERIEIVRGPVSVLYGADAVSGVVHIITRRGRGPLAGELAVEGGSLGARDLRGRLGGAAGRWHASLAGSRFAADGSYPFNNQYLNGSGSLNLGWEGGRTGSVSLTGRYSDVLAHFPTDGAGVPVDINQRVLDRDLTVGLRAARNIGGLGITLDGWLHRLDSDFRDPQDNPADTTGFGFAGTRDAMLERRGAQLRGDRSIGGLATLSVGVGLERESETQQSLTLSNFGFGLDETPGNFVAERRTLFGHGQLLVAIGPSVDMQAGVRHDDSDAFGGFTTWRVGVVWRPAAGWRAWTAAGTAFKAPLFSELFASSAFEVGNPALRPERSGSVEAGLEWQGRSHGLALTGYHQRHRDLIQYLSAPPGEPTYANLGAANSRGIEATATVRPVPAILIRGRWGWLSTEVTDSGVASTATFAQGQPLLRRPAQSGGVVAILSLAGGTASVGYDWVGSRDDVDFRDFPATRITLPSYGVAGASLTAPLLRAAPGRPGVELHLRGENLFAADWDQVVGFAGRGRTVAVGGRITY